MDPLTAYIAGFLTPIWALLLVKLDNPHKVQDSKQKLLEPYEVADQWYQTITKENTKKTSRRQA